MQKLLANLPRRLEDELVTVLARNRHVRIERIVSTGHASATDFWYDQAEHEWVVVLQGEGVLEFAQGETVVLKPGDSLLIPAHRRHRVQATAAEEPTVWLAVFFAD